MTEEIGNEGEIIAFISASFDDSAQEPIRWFIEMAESLGIKTIWLKEKPETRRIEDKIKDSLRKCNAFIQILTEDVERESREKGWLGNEPAWAGSSGITNFALFVEKGARASGFIVTKTEPLFFDRNALAEIAPKVIDYLRDLKQRTSESQHQKQEEKSRKREKVFTPGYR
ncbi:MAG: hypothetical protein N2V75_01985 [Methanophagales archaeon]|nr:hypothetical protein [Methanophagales archaeon]